MNEAAEKTMRVLVIEDNAGDARLIQEALAEARGERYEVVWADKLSHGLDLVARDNFDLVLVDLILPAESRGLVTFERVHGLAPEVPKVVLTSFDDEAMAAQAVHMGAQDYLVEGTLDSRSLVRAIRHALERHRLLKELRELSLSDELTGLRNRRGFMVLAEQHLKVARRMRQRLLLFYVDLDGMKPINDTYGHSAGDRALVGTARILRETFRESDILARFGGDEFVALSIAASEPSVVGLQTRLRRRVDARNAPGDLPFKIGLTAGYAVFDGEGALTLEELMARADADLYEKKRAKRTDRPDVAKTHRDGP